MTEPTSSAATGLDALGGRASRVTRLPPEIRLFVERRLREQATLDEIVEETAAMLSDLGQEPLSRSGLHRHKQRFERVTARIKAAGRGADSIVKTVEEAATGAGNITRASTQMLRTAIFDMMLRADAEGGAGLTEQQLGKLALALRRIEDTDRVSEQRERDLRQAIRDRLREDLEDSDSTTPSAETLEILDRSIMGEFYEGPK